MRKKAINKYFQVKYYFEIELITLTVLHLWIVNCFSINRVDGIFTVQVLNPLKNLDE